VHTVGASRFQCNACDDSGVCWLNQLFLTQVAPELTCNNWPFPELFDSLSTLTEVHSAIWIAFESDLEPHFRCRCSLRDVEEVVDPRLVEDEFLVVDRVEGACTKAVAYGRRLVLLAAARRTSPVEELTAELCELAAEEVGLKLSGV
jgi:hypothetical protein